MAKKGETIDLGEVSVDLTQNEEIGVEIVKKAPIETEKKRILKKSRDEEDDTPLINCLSNQLVTVRFVNKDTGFIDNPKHVLYGGMAETAVRVLTVPMLRGSQGVLKNVLTNAEKDYLEYAMSLEDNALSVYNRKNNYWRDYTVRLTKQDTILNLAIPEDYIKYKVLLANDDIVAPNIATLENSPKATYQFVLISDEEEISNESKHMSTAMEASMLLGTILDNKAVLKYVVETIEGKPISNDSKLEYIKTQAYKSMQSNPKLFISIVKDPLLETKVFLQTCVLYGLVRKRQDLYYLSSDNTPLCAINEDPTINVAAKHLNKPVNQELKLTLEAKIKALKE